MIAEETFSKLPAVLRRRCVEQRPAFVEWCRKWAEQQDEEGAVTISKRGKKNRSVKSGPGTELETLFAGWSKFLGLSAELGVDDETLGHVAAAGHESCIGCKGLRKLMNKWGPDECERRIDDDPTSADKTRRNGIVTRIRENAAGHKIKRLGVTFTVDQLPGFDFAIRKLVEKAIRLAREKQPLIQIEPPLPKLHGRRCELHRAAKSR